MWSELVFQQENAIHCFIYLKFGADVCMQCNEELGQKSEKFVSGFVRWQLSGFESFPTNLLSFGLMSSNVHNLQCERHHRSLQTFTWETFIVEKKWKLGLLTQVADVWLVTPSTADRLLPTDWLVRPPGLAAILSNRPESDRIFSYKRSPKLPSLYSKESHASFTQTGLMSWKLLLCLNNDPGLYKK